MDSPLFTARTVQRFWSKVQKTESCWLWTGYCLRRGHSGRGKGRGPYGCVAIGTRGKNMLAHRLSWVLHFGPIPDGIWVLHHCDNPPCVNPAHLFLGTHADNMADMVRKGRSDRDRRGERNPSSKLTGAKVSEIRGMLAQGLPQRVIATRYAISPAMVSYINTGRYWADG